MRLYHGSTINIETILLGKSKPFKDFGKAFYLSDERSQAQELAESRAAFLGGDAVVNEFETVYSSDTYQALQNPQTNLYFQSSGYVYAYLLAEIKTGKMQ